MSFEDLTGQSVATLRVQHLERRNPLAWRCVCTRCDVSQVHTHTRLRNDIARCGNSGCGRTAPKSNISESDERALQAAQLEQARQQAIANEITEAKARDAAKSRAEAQRIELLKSGYLRYWNYVMGQAGDDRPITMEAWQRLGSAGREKVMERVDKNLPIHFTITEYESSRTFRPQG
jgi:hypothetical protein